MEWVKGEGIAFEPVKRPADFPPFVVRDDLLKLGAQGTQQQLVGLLQVRHVADTTRACVQNVVRSRRTVEAKIGVEPLFCKVKVEEHLQLGKLLDLDGNAVVRGYRLDALRIDSTPSILYSSKS